ncbi:MAG: flagellar biosynthesis protein FlaG [Arcobacter sp.]|nr:MAG: flagellar biosynthesis protein FlaG [Arcobacter sp.]
MEIQNNIDQQQSIKQTSSSVKTAPKQEVRTQVEDIQKKSGDSKPITSEVEARELVDSLNKALDPFSTSLRFGFDNSSDIFYVSVIDTNTSNMIRRFPLEQAATLTAKMNEVTGIIFDEKG